MTTQEAILKECAEAKQKITESLINRIWRNNSTLIYSGSTEARIILDALEKQVPKKARYKIVGNGWNDWAEGKCPVCGVNIKNTPIYCPCCGQGIDWSDTE